ncbi:diguanylate cyclase domain-containing protein [Actinoplanes sp. NPDC049599]|uniref:diguanylate cyclase domain-containing protein n=1 Tax=Actinoplanes sp. NPDC049599 TaxID=3363903 RepID=UPI0037A9F0DD
MVRDSLSTVYARVRAYVRRDLMRSVRLLFLLALGVTSVGLTMQVARMGVGLGSTVTCAAVLLAGLGLRVTEFRRVRPVPIWVDVLELAGVFLVLSQVTAVHPVISAFFMAVFFRAAVGRLPRLILSQVGYLAVWLLAAVLFPATVVTIPGAMTSLPLTSLLVYGMRVLMLRIQEQQEAQNALLAGVLRELPFPVVVTNAEGTVVLANPAVRELVGWPRTGEPYLGELRLQDLEERPVNLHDVVAASGAAAGRAELEVRLIRTAGATRQIKVQTVPMAKGFGAGSGMILALLDVTAERLYEQHLQQAAYFDMLTGLPNRRLLFERLHLAHSTAMPYAMLLIDLNDFKAVNDTLGHRIGDELLAGIAERIRTAVDESATVARLGGDEFAVLLPHATTADAEAAAQAVRGSFAAPLQLSCGPLHGHGTVGLTVAEPGWTPDEVMERADAAMYLAKPDGQRRTRSSAGARNNRPVAGAEAR